MSGRPRAGRSLKPLRHPRFWAALWCLAIAAVVVSSLMPPPPMPECDGSDKWSHFLAYFALAASAAQLFRGWPALLGAGLGLVLLGIGIVTAVSRTRRKDPAETKDALANTLGVIAGLGTRLTPLHDLLLRIDRGRSSGSD